MIPQSAYIPFDLQNQLNQKSLQSPKHLDARVQLLELFPLNIKIPIPQTRKEDSSDLIVTYKRWQKIELDKLRN